MSLALPSETRLPHSDSRFSHSDNPERCSLVAGVCACADGITMSDGAAGIDMATGWSSGRVTSGWMGGGRTGIGAGIGRVSWAGRGGSERPSRG